MKIKTLTLFVLLFTPVTAILGSGAIYLLNEIVQKANSTSYTAEEEDKLIESMIDLAKQGQIESSELVRIFESEKKQRTASREVASSIQNIRNSAIQLLGFIALGQLYLVFLLKKKINGERVSHN